MVAATVLSHRMVDISAELFDGSYHDVDSSEIAFKIAGSQVLKWCKMVTATVLFGSGATEQPSFFEVIVMIEVRL